MVRSHALYPVELQARCKLVGGSLSFDDLASDDPVRSQTLYPAELRAHSREPFLF